MTPEDLLFLAGQGCVAAGVFMLNVPAGLIVSGLLLVYDALALGGGAQPQPKQPRKE